MKKVLMIWGIGVALLATFYTQLPLCNQHSIINNRVYAAIPPNKKIADKTNKYDKIILKYSKKYKVNKYLIKSVIKNESGFNASARSKGNCLGLMQLSKFRKCPKPFNPDTNIEYGTKHLAGLLARYNGNEKLAISAYNVGGSRVKNKIAPCTKKYVTNVLAFKKKLEKDKDGFRPY